MSEIPIRIMVLVGSNGKATASVEGDLGWGDLADNIMDWNGSTNSDPDATDRYIVTISVPIPAIKEVSALAHPSSPDHKNTELREAT